MAAICEILQELPDEASRMRVMHWAFGRFAPEFKRQAPPMPQAATTPATRTPLAPATTVVAAPTASRVATPSSPEEMDFDRQVSELDDLFPADGGRLPRAAFADAF